MNEIVQSQFYKFHDNIKLNDLDDNQPLREKRDMLVNEIRKYLKDYCDEEEIELITFDAFNQGSYAMGTGVKPVWEEDDYDIDVGLSFNISKGDYDPLKVKKWVVSALEKKQFRSVILKKPCVRVQYKEDGLHKFHVDFAIYAGPSKNYLSTYIAKGKESTPKNEFKWEDSDPKKLISLIESKFSDPEEKSQFKRVIRFLKRWKDLKFNSASGTPTGIAITVLAYNGFKAYTKNNFSSKKEIDDLKATYEFVKYILNQFFFGKISTHLPVVPRNDLFEKMTAIQATDFKEKLEKLRDCLKSAIDETDPHEACKKLHKQFGDAFPIPPKEETAQSRSQSFAKGSESA